MINDIYTVFFSGAFFGFTILKSESLVLAPDRWSGHPP